MESVDKRTRWGSIPSAVFSIGVIAALSAVILFGSEKISLYFDEGLRLAAERVLPTAFPFMVLSSVAVAMIDTSAMPRLTRGFKRVFAVSGQGFPAMVVGWLAGFPIGAKMTADIYRSGALTRSEAERLIAYSGCASPPFVIAVLGVGMLGDAALGIILLLSVYLGAVLSAQLYRGNDEKTEIYAENTRQKYDFVDSVRSSAASSVYMLAFITLFYIVAKFARETIKFAPLGTAVTLILEITGALAHVTASGLSLPPTMALSSFALGFGGLSVMAQTAAVIKGSGLRMRYYLPIKLAHGILSALCAMALSALYMLVF